MKKISFLMLLLFLFSGCTQKQNNIITKIEKTDEYKIGINYPITNTKLDKTIENDINNIITSFKEKNEEELNIDYVFNELGDYISVGLFITEDENNQIHTYAFDKKKNKNLLLDDITDDIDVIEEYSDSLLFTFDSDYFTFYEDNTEIQLPISDINLKIDLKKEETIKTDVVIPNKVIDPNSKVIALTFDDGPSIYTEEIVDYLKEQDCNSTFFILGNKVEMYQELLRKSLSYGNELGNHSYNHKWLIKLTEQDFEEQINKTQNIIQEYTGFTPKILRPTYGSLNETIKNNTDLDIVLWSVDTMDWKYKNVDTIVKRATENLKDGDIILMHDIKLRTVKAVKKIVPILKEKGFTCVTISELNEIKLLREKWNE
jgi:peptidoglycan/xylan/chitin deacetylase (PgdA/CDA1 family)